MPYPTLVQRYGDTLPATNLEKGEGFVLNKADGDNKAGYYAGVNGVTTFIGPSDGSGEGSCECGVEVTYDTASGGSYTISAPSDPEEGTEYYFIVKNNGGGNLTLNYTSFSGTASITVPAGQIGEVSMLHFTSGWVSRSAVTAK